MELLQPHFGQIAIPTANSKVYKDECVYSFDTPVSFMHFKFVNLVRFVLSRLRPGFPNKFYGYVHISLQKNMMTFRFAPKKK